MKREAKKAAKVGIKHDNGKLRYDLIPIAPLEELARVFTVGGNLYGDHNWEKGIKLSRLYAAMQRHLTSYWKGEQVSEDNGIHHLAAVAWGALAMMEMEVIHPELDDRPPGARELAL